MPSRLYEDIVSQRGSLENLVAKIPGFRGYQEMAARREADQLLRAYLTSEFERLVQRYTQIENEILAGGKGLKHMTRTREVKSRMQAYVDRVSTAAPKYSGMWASIKIGPEQAEQLYAFDEAQMRFQLKFEQALTALHDAVRAGEDFGPQLDAVYDAANEANEAYQLRDDEILNLADSMK